MGLTRQSVPSSAAIHAKCPTKAKPPTSATCVGASQARSARPAKGPVVVKLVSFSVRAEEGEGEEANSVKAKMIAPRQPDATARRRNVQTQRQNPITSQNVTKALR